MFELTGSLLAELQPKLDCGVYHRALMSHTIRRTAQANAKPPLVNTYNAILAAIDVGIMLRRGSRFSWTATIQK